MAGEGATHSEIRPTGADEENRLVAEPPEGASTDGLQRALELCHAARLAAEGDSIDPLTAGYLLLAEQGLRVAAAERTGHLPA